jgi:hypothetical protein
MVVNCTPAADQVTEIVAIHWILLKRVAAGAVTAREIPLLTTQILEVLLDNVPEAAAYIAELTHRAQETIRHADELSEKQHTVHTEDEDDGKNTA